MKPEVVETAAGDAGLRQLLDAAQHQNTITVISRYGEPAAVIVPIAYYREQADREDREMRGCGSGWPCKAASGG